NRDIWPLLPVAPRDGYLGARTETFIMMSESDENSKIYYYDFVALYSHILKSKRFMIGEPVILTGDQIDSDNIEQYFGLIKLSIHPPRGLFFPVLPMKVNMKLVFGLCRQCMETFQQKICNHSDEDRMLHSTWTSMEVVHAIRRGYKIAKIHQIIHYPQSSVYNKETREEGLFSEFVNSLLKQRMLMSGWPRNVTAAALDDVVRERLEDEYIKRVLEKENISLDREKIQN